MDLTADPGRQTPTVRAFDPNARSRIEDVATALLDLNATLEERLALAEQRIVEMEDALTQLGLVQVPHV